MSGVQGTLLGARARTTVGRAGRSNSRVRVLPPRAPASRRGYSWPGVLPRCSFGQGREGRVRLLVPPAAERCKGRSGESGPLDREVFVFLEQAAEPPDGVPRATPRAL